MLEMIDDKIAVIPIFDPDKSPSGLLYIPDQAKERVDQGIVYAVGPKCKFIKPGDYIVFSGYTGTTLKIDEGTFILFKEEFAVAKIVAEEVDATEVPGLFFRDKEGVYFPATVEFALGFVAKALEDAPWRRTMKSKNMLEHRPKPS